MAYLGEDFARAVTGKLKLLSAGVDRLVICASPRMLGQGVSRYEGRAMGMANLAPRVTGSSAR